MELRRVGNFYLFVQVFESLHVYFFKFLWDKGDPTMNH